MFTKTMMLYFAVYVIANFIALLLASKILNDVNCGNKLKLFCFTILLTVAQFTLDYFVKLNILYTIFLFPLIYIAIIYVLMNITRLIRILGFGAVLKTSLMVVFFQLCTRGLLAWKLGHILNNIKF